MNQRNAETIPDTASAAARRVIELARMAAGVYGRPDLEGTITIALGRIDRPETLIAVIGEFKKGKSSLINALLGADIAPVDDDLATAVTSLYRHGEQPFATVLSTEDGKDIERAVPLEEALALVREQENPGNARGIRAVEFHISNEFLKTGAVLIDTPGFGGVALSGEGVSQVLLRAVHAVVVVADASMPLSRPELDLINKAATACPAILLALSKTDLYPSWRNILADDEATLSAAGLDLPVLPLSSALMGHALRRQDDALATESGVPALRDSMESLIMETSRAAECLRGLAEARSAIGQISESARHELAALEAPEGAARQAAELEAARADIEHLRGPGSRWSQVLADVLADTSGEADHQFRLALRTLGREIDAALDQMDPGKEWDALARMVRARVGAAVDTLFEQVEAGARSAEQSVLEWLRTSEGLDLTNGGPGTVTALADWAPAPIERPGYSAYAGTLFTGLRGGQGGIFTIGMVAGLAGITLTTAATAGIGLLFGGKQILDERKRQLQARRQAARAHAKQFLDDIQFETNKRVRDFSRDLQRQLRDGFLELVATRQRTYADSLGAVQAAMQQDASARAGAIASLRERLEQLRALEARASELEAAL